MRSLRISTLLLVFAAAPSPAQTNLDAPLTADAIMARVAANQDSTESARTNHLYIQHTHILSRKGATVMCEETTDSRVIPSGKASHQELLKLSGRVLQKKSYVAYNAPAEDKSGPNNPAPANASHDGNLVEPPDDLDVEVVESMRSSLTSTDTKDGIGSNLFPLTTKEQEDKTFTLIGREHRNGRDVYHLTFRPKDKNDINWKGDVYIDAEAFQPVLVSTAMSRKMPFAVRTLLGTNLPGLGFTVTYAPQPDGVWFPTTFGTEFKIHVLYFFHREIVLTAQNRDFEKTHVTSHILGDVTLPEPPNTQEPTPDSEPSPTTPSQSPSAESRSSPRQSDTASHPGKTSPPGSP